MKKIFSLAIALIATIGIANAQEKTMLVNLTSGSTVEYNISEVESVTFGESAWVSLGYAEYTDDCFTTFFYAQEEGDLAIPYDVEIQENSEEPGLYRLVNPYGAAYPWNAPGDWDTSKNYYMEINATDPTYVYIEIFDTGCDWGYGDFSIASEVGFYLDYYGYSLSFIKANGIEGGTLVDGVITFPTQGMVVSMANYYGGGWYYANYYGKEKIVLPSARSGAGAQKSNSVKNEGVTKNLVNTAKPVELKEIAK